MQKIKTSFKWANYHTSVHHRCAMHRKKKKGGEREEERELQSNALQRAQCYYHEKFPQERLSERSNKFRILYARLL